MERTAEERIELAESLIDTKFGNIKIDSKDVLDIYNRSLLGEFDNLYESLVIQHNQ